MNNKNSLNQTNQELSNIKAESWINKAEYLVSVALLLFAGFLGSQKLIHTVQSDDSAVNIHSLAKVSCANGVRLKSLHCDQRDQQIEPVGQRSEQHSKQKIVNQQVSQQGLQAISEKQITTKQAPAKTAEPEMNARMVLPLEGLMDLPLREQLAHLPELKHTILQLRWRDGDEQDAARLLSIVNTLTLARADPYKAQFAAPAMSGLLSPVWDKYPYLVASSHCLYCGSFFDNVLKGYIATGTQDKEWFSHFLAGHPRFLRIAYDADQVDDQYLKEIATLHAELLRPGDAQTAKFIGNVLLREKNYTLLHRWATSGMNGQSSFEAAPDYHSLPRELLIDAWQTAVSGGYDNARLTRHLIETGYRPALRWLLWLSAGNVEYIKTHYYKNYEKQRYDDFLKQTLDIPSSSFSDLAGFYSENWDKIDWNDSAKRWELQR